MSDKKGVHALVSGLHHFGVTDVVISPGSRNAPLIISLNRSGYFRCHSIPDERVAAFYALGMALASARPVAVVCTSGSAGINLAPALAEAYYLKVPVVAITADRPLEWTDQGNGQTIRQEGLFSNFIRGACHIIEQPKNVDEAWRNRREISKLFNSIRHEVPGPIHFNVPLSEPLYHTENYPPEAIPHFYERKSTAADPDAAFIADLRRQAAAAPKVMVLLGQMAPNPALAAAIKAMSTWPNVVILTETTSNVNGAGVVGTIDRVVMPLTDTDLLDELMPDLLITAGGMIVSKKVKALLREQPRLTHWHVSPHDRGLDTFRQLSLEIPYAPEAFFAALVAEGPFEAKSTYNARWRHMDALAAAGHQQYMDGLPWSDFAAFHILLKALPAPIALHMANSSPVRYVQLFGPRSGVTYHANRGTSGIDGSTSTAAGWARLRPDETAVLVTGDTAFLYDSNALWNKEFPRNLKICVVNNSGGGIFRIIDGPAKTEELEPFFEAHHPASIGDLTKAFGLAHYHADCAEALTQAVHAWLEHEGPAILEVATPARENAPILKGYFKEIAKHYADDRKVETAVSGREKN